jgi:hypothetical protein
VSDEQDGGAGPNSAQREASAQAFRAAKSDRAAAGEALPDIDFATFILSLSHSALVHLGDAPNPASGKTEVSLPLARQTIDLLCLLQDKSKGNLTGEEERILDQALFDLRMRYVEVAKAR